MTRAEQLRTKEQFEHTAYLMQAHGWTSAQATTAMKYYGGHITIEQLRAELPTLADEIVKVR